MKVSGRPQLCGRWLSGGLEANIQYKLSTGETTSRGPLVCLAGQGVSCVVWQETGGLEWSPITRGSQVGAGEGAPPSS